jgi:WD40 repeat protein
MDGRVHLWDLHSSQTRAVLEHPDGVVKVVALEGGRLLTASVDLRLRLWDCRAASLLRSWTGHRDIPLDFAVSP